MKTTFLIIFLFMSILASSQTSRVISFGRTDQSLVGSDGIIDRSGNYVVGYYGDDHNGIAFVDANHNSLWVKDIGDAGTHRMIELENHNYLSIGGPYMMSFDSLGNTLWQKKMYGTAHFSEVIELDSNNIIASFREGVTVGFTNIKSDGSANWTKEIDNNFGLEIAVLDLFQTLDSNFIVVSYSAESAGNVKMLLMKCDKNGNVLWEKYHSSINHTFYLRNGLQASDGNIYVVGSVNSVDSTTTDLKDMVVLKFDSNGDFINGGQYSHIYDDSAYDIKEDKSNQLVVVGNTKPHLVCGGNLTVLRLETHLDTIYTKTYGTLNANGAFHWELHKRDDDFYSYGYGSLWSPFNSSDCYVISTDENFDLDCYRYDQELTVGAFTDLTLSSSNITYQNYTLNLLDSIGGSNSFIHVADGCTGDILNTDELVNQEISVYPNPTSGSFQFRGLSGFENSIEVLVHDSKGKLIRHLQNVSESSLINLNQPGLYYVTILKNTELIGVRKLTVFSI